MAVFILSGTTPIFEANKRGKPRKRLKTTDKTEVEGLKFGRYPFAAAATRYTERRYGTVAPSTQKEEKRKYVMLGKMFEQLKGEGKIKTTDPRHLRREDIQQFLAMMRERGIDVSAQVTYLSLLNNLLKSYKNHIVAEMKADGVRFPKAPKKKIRTIAQDDLQTIFETVSEMKGWRGSVSKGLFALCYATGIRPSEARLAQVDDLDLAKGTFYVREPKGKGSWASCETVDIIREDMMPFLRQYKDERAIYLKDAGREDIRALFPSIENETGFYSANGLRLVKAKVEKITGIDFKIKDFRSTLTTVTVNGDLSRLTDMSVQLRHSSPTTTQRSYAAIDRSAAGRKLKDAYKESQIITSKTPLIEKYLPLAGYG